MFFKMLFKLFLENVIENVIVNLQRFSKKKYCDKKTFLKIFFQNNLSRKTHEKKPFFTTLLFQKIFEIFFLKHGNLFIERRD